ncbi:MAG: hypothetical protein ABEJ07_04085 [Candidatus Nanohaloarchaea archaeon]
MTSSAASDYELPSGLSTAIEEPETGIASTATVNERSGFHRFSSRKSGRDWNSQNPSRETGTG